jgi:hypothetical protein
VPEPAAAAAACPAPAVGAFGCTGCRLRPYKLSANVACMVERLWRSSSSETSANTSSS